ncbi:hemolysin TlyA family protein, partial [Candidatus Omnitrophus magneticus]
MKKRLDILVFERGYAVSRERASAIIMEGNVLVNGVAEIKAGTKFKDDAVIELKNSVHPYVSRGGLKLAHGLREFGVIAAGKTAMDVGASTGGFTDCLLQNGAARVYAIDVGYGQLAWKLRKDPRVIPIDRTNIRWIF